MAIILAILGVGGVLVGYVLLERLISQRLCRYCGFRVSIDGIDEPCPRCGSLIPEIDKTQSLRNDSDLY